MAADNFDLQGWMREQKQGPYAGPNGVEKTILKSSKPKSKTGLNEGLMGLIDLQPVGHLSEEFTDDDFAAGMNDEEDLDNYYNSYPEENELGEARPSAKAPSMPINQKWDLISIEDKEGMLDSVDDSEEGLADYAYMGWAMVPDEVKTKISGIVMSAKVDEPEPDEDEKIAALAMKQAKKGAKAVKGLNPEKDIRDLLYGTDDDDDFDM
jgi:hypothetical protein